VYCRLIKKRVERTISTCDVTLPQGAVPGSRGLGGQQSGRKPSPAAGCQCDQRPQLSHWTPSHLRRRSPVPSGMGLTPSGMNGKRRPESDSPSGMASIATRCPHAIGAQTAFPGRQVALAVSLFGGREWRFHTMLMGIFSAYAHARRPVKGSLVYQQQRARRHEIDQKSTGFLESGIPSSRNPELCRDG